jgi:ribonuclease HI
MAIRLHCTNLVVHSDSELLVRQMQGKYKVKEPKLREFVQEARGIIARAGFQCRFIHVTRERNKEADQLANRGIDSKHPVRF